VYEAIESSGIAVPEVTIYDDLVRPGNNFFEEGKFGGVETVGEMGV